jgi:hypothetical protein
VVSIQPQFAENMTAAQACRLREQARDKLEPGLQHALVLAAGLVPTG